DLNKSRLWTQTGCCANSSPLCKLPTEPMFIPVTAGAASNWHHNGFHLLLCLSHFMKSGCIPPKYPGYISGSVLSLAVDSGGRIGAKAFAPKCCRWSKPSKPKMPLSCQKAPKADFLLTTCQTLQWTATHGQPLASKPIGRLCVPC